MATHFASVEKNERNIPHGMIDDARKHVYEAAIRTPLVRLNYDGPAEIYLKLECLQPIGSFKICGAPVAGGRAAARGVDGECGQRRSGSCARRA
jgi:threonine dehydratase